jgi:hypothetical protein
MNSEKSNAWFGIAALKKIPADLVDLPKPQRRSFTGAA